MARIALLRHGHTDWNRAGRIQGRTDIPLDDEARKGLGMLRLPEPWGQAKIVSSPLLRAMETAKLVSDKTPVIVPDLIEMDWGAWEGLQGVDLRADPESGYRDIEEWGPHFCPPNGEPLQAVLKRTSTWVQAQTEDTVAVCHIGVMRAILATATGWQFRGPAPFRIKRNRLYVLDNMKLMPTPVRLEERSPCA